MKITGTHKCNSKFGPCGEVYEWMYIVPQPMSDSIYKVHVIDRPRAERLLKVENEYTFKTYCPRCRQENIFKHTV